MNLTETNDQINIYSENSFLSNNRFESHLIAKSFNMFLTLL